MANVKQVIIWEPKRSEKRKADGSVVPNEFVGKFRTRVQEGTPNAIRHTGRNDAGVEWDYWGVDVDSIAGKVRWIDIRDGGDYGLKIALFLESQKSLHQLTIPYDVRNLRRVMNHLCGLRKELEVAVVNVSYWVRKATDKNGNPKLDNMNRPIWAKDLSFRDVPEKFTFDEWKTFAAENGLDWFQETRGGKKVWNYESELKFWTGMVVKVQRFLLGTATVLPFCWNSVTASVSDGTEYTLTAEEIEELNAIYELIKPLYRFPFSRVETSADNVMLAPSADHTQAEPKANHTTRQPATMATSDDFPTQDLTSYPVGNAKEVPVPDDDDLPF